MRFHYGAIPEDPAFQPKAEGWKGIREPGPIALQIMAIPVVLVIFVLLGEIILVIAPDLGVRQNQVRLGINFFTLRPIGLAALGGLLETGLVLLFGALLVVFLHEVLHTVFMPDWGRSARSLIAVWPEKMLFYAIYMGPLPRNQLLLVYLTPLLVLTGLPLVLLAILGQFPGTLTAQGMLATLALVNGGGACGDIMAIFLVLFQIPANAMVQNQGWRSYWKVIQPVGG